MKMEAVQTNTTVLDKINNNKTLLQIIYTYIYIYIYIYIYKLKLLLSRHIEVEVMLHSFLTYVVIR